MECCGPGGLIDHTGLPMCDRLHTVILIHLLESPGLLTTGG